MRQAAANLLQCTTAVQLTCFRLQVQALTGFSDITVPAVLQRQVHADQLGPARLIAHLTGYSLQPMYTGSNGRPALLTSVLGMTAPRKRAPHPGLG